MKRSVLTFGFFVFVGAMLMGCGDAGEAVSDRPAGDITPGEGGAKEAAGGAAQAPAPSPGPQ